MRKRPGPGQPAKGPKGERVTDYPTLLVKIPQQSKRSLEALSVLRRIPQWRLVDEALREYIAKLPDDERDRVERSRGRKGLRQFKAEKQMSRVSGQAWFDQGCEAFKRSFPAIAAEIPADRFYVCPICLRAFSEEALRVKALTRDHVPPESLGGKRLVLTCVGCNSEGGHGADSHARREADLIGFVASDVREIKAHLRTSSGRVPIRLSAGSGGIRMLGVPRATSKATHDAVYGDFTEAAQDGKWQDFRFKVDFPSFSPDRAAASWLRSGYLAFFAALGYRFIYRPELDAVRARIKNPELKEPSTFRIIRPEKSEPTLIRIEEPEPFRSYAMFYDRHAVLLPRYNDSTLYARLAAQPAGMVTFTGSQIPWPTNGPTLALDS